MKILNDYPPNHEDILAHGMNPSSRVVYTYGDTIYNPSGAVIPEDVIRHEEVHFKQQGDNPDAWWQRYLMDALFRVGQESEAYATQYDFICTYVKDRNKRLKVLLDLSRILSSPIYGVTLSPNDCFLLIKNKIKTKR